MAWCRGESVRSWLLQDFSRCCPGFPLSKIYPWDLKSRCFQENITGVLATFSSELEGKKREISEVGCLEKFPAALTRIVDVLPPSRVISRSESAASTSSTSLSLWFRWFSEDMMDSLLMWYWKARPGSHLDAPVTSGSHGITVTPCGKRSGKPEWETRSRDQQILGGFAGSGMTILDVNSPRSLQALTPEGNLWTPQGRAALFTGLRLGGTSGSYLVPLPAPAEPPGAAVQDHIHWLWSNSRDGHSTASLGKLC